MNLLYKLDNYADYKLLSSTGFTMNDDNKKITGLNPFRLGLAQNLSSPLLRQLASFLELPLEKLTALDYLASAYDKLKQDRSAEDFVDSVLAELNIVSEVVRGSMSQIPKTGPVMVVANHPFGGLEGVLMIQLLRDVRPDVKLLANFLLNRIPELRQYFISVDPFESKTSKQTNVSSLRASLSYLKSGGLLGVFPSGTVSHLSLGRRDISDPIWNPSVARIAQITGATVVPLFFHGTNGPFFQAMGLVHPLLRTLLLPRELANKRNKTIRVSIGAPIPSARLSEFSSEQELSDYLRLRTYILGGKDLLKKQQVSALQGSAKQQPILDAQDPLVLAKEVSQLPSTQCLLNSGKFHVYCASSQQIPRVLTEIGRLREITFRSAQEGTGKPIDVDIFDNLYEHLFVWNHSKSEIVGAYRIGKVDKILEKYGRTGLYTHTLFFYKDSLLKQLGPALELGRSFVRSEYQKDYSALLCLWQGIGRYVSLNPRYRVLFGPVSISSEYDAASRQLIVDFLKVNRFENTLAREIKPRTPLPRFSIRGVGRDQVRVVKDVSDVGELLQELESVHSTVPVLLRQYIKLGAKILGFNLDPEFGDVLDALLYVDLLETERKFLDKYLGKEGAENFVSYHTKKSDDAEKN